MSKKAVMVGLLAGAVAGALAGILMAPDKGSKTRKNLTGKGKETVDGLKTGFNNFVDSMINKFSSATDEMNQKDQRSGSATS